MCPVLIRSSSTQTHSKHSFTRQQVVEAARQWIGVPWKHLGRTGNGIDCAGLVIVVAKSLGYSDYDVKTYGRRPHDEDLLKHFDKEMDRVHKSNVKKGDVLIFREGRYACHCGFLAEKGGHKTIIHAYARPNYNRVLEEPFGFEWPTLVKLGYRFRGILD